MIKSPRGTKDILIEENSSWQKIEDESRKIFHIFGYSELRTPIIEEAAVFIRSLGKGSDIVNKQIFYATSHDKEKTKLCLRPEGTAGVIRCYIENNLDKKLGFAKLYYIGPMFRAERPQKGRLRQFNHIGAEAVGASSPYLDVEIINLAVSILDALGLKDYKLRINSLGCKDDKKNISDFLRKNIKPVVKKLCKDCNQRFSRNILRILDCKNENCKEILQNALGKADFKKRPYLCKDCLSDIEIVENTLRNLNINYNFDHFLVRGLDYYTKTVFEINHPNLGAQDAIGAGGRYDNLVKDLDGPAIGAVGFALGVERLIIAGNLASQASNKKIEVFIIGLGDKAKEKTVLLLNDLRKEGINSDTDYENKSLKGQLRKANDLGAGFVCIIGDDELLKGVVTVKDMASGAQEETGIADFIKTMKFKLSKGD